MWNENTQYYAYMIWMAVSIVMFIAILGWVLWPGSRERLERHANIPLLDDEDEVKS